MSDQSPLLAHRTATPPALDGRLADPCWQQAVRSGPFVDMATGNPTVLETRVAALWDDTCLYLGFWVEEPYPRAKLTERDSLIFRENDVEVFIDGGDCYYEFEINALGTIYEVFFIWRDAFKKGGRFDLPEFDLWSPKTYSFGGDFDRQPDHFWEGTHPRGTRWAFTGWDMPGLRSAVHVDGVLNDPRVRSKGWTVEIAIPWASMQHLANGRTLPPTEGDVWKIFFGRFQKIGLGATEAQGAWCLTPHGVTDTHQPDKFTPVQFVGPR